MMQYLQLICHSIILIIKSIDVVSVTTYNVSVSKYYNYVKGDSHELIIIVAETGSDITPELAAKYNITLVPMHVTFDSHTMDDGSFSSENL